MSEENNTPVTEPVTEPVVEPTTEPVKPQVNQTDDSYKPNFDTAQQDYVNKLIKDAKGKSATKVEQGRLELATELGFDTVDAFKSHITETSETIKGFKVLQEENASLKAAKLSAEKSSVFGKYNIESESLQNKLATLADLETEGSYTDKLEAVVKDLGLFKTKVGADHQEHTPENTSEFVKSFNANRNKRW